jgi:AcrR family transcriptional regulator
MARRKDHTPEQLSQLIVRSAEKILHAKGTRGLTARALADAVGYAPGTIYNLFRDMDAVVTEINFNTLGRLHDLCAERTNAAPRGMYRVKALAYAYTDFARGHRRAWETMFMKDGAENKAHLPKHYHARLHALFTLIEATLQDNLALPAAEAGKIARLLWACLHGITVLSLDGRTELVGAGDAKAMIDDLLNRQLAAYIN